MQIVVHQIAVFFFFFFYKQRGYDLALDIIGTKVIKVNESSIYHQFIECEEYFFVSCQTVILFSFFFLQCIACNLAEISFRV